MCKFLFIIPLVLLFGAPVLPAPRLSFFSELKGTDFKTLIDDSSLVSQLMRMKASLRVGLIDLTAERAEAIQKLNRAGVPVYAWLLLPESEGYWFFMNNGDKATARYQAFKKWTAENNLHWEGIGIDLEMDFNDAKLGVKHPLALAWKAYMRLFDRSSIKRGKAIYQQLVLEMQSDGYKVESYLIPLIYEERLKKTSSLQKLIGMIDIETPVEIPMAYTSVMGKGMISAYPCHGNPIGLGVTGGGVNIEGRQPKFLKWEDLSRDLLVSNQQTSEVIIFCLEATVTNGWMNKIEHFDYSQPVPDISRDVEAQIKMRKTFQTVMVILDHPWLFTLEVLVILFLFFYLVYKSARGIIWISKRIISKRKV